MKLKRLAALGLTLALTLSLAVTSASAATYSFADIEKHWARGYIDEMQKKGLAVGWEEKDAQGNTVQVFKPDGQMTATEALLFCARAAQLDSATIDRIAADHRQEVYEALPASIAAWKSDPAKELAAGIQVGVLTLDELSDLADAGALGTTMTRESVSRYLVRAMQLEPLAKSLKTYTLSYTDTDQISEEFRPYVYVLTMYGVVEGTDKNTFEPKKGVTRAEMTKLLSCTLEVIKERGIQIELSEYTDYDWQGGVITAVSEGKNGSMILTLKSEISGTRSYTVPAGAELYRDNMLQSLTANNLAVGQYARLNLSSGKTVSQVRLGGVVSTYTGKVSSLSDDKIDLVSGGSSYEFDISRFTEVQVGQNTGDRTVIDPEAGYTDATCYVTAMGDLVAVKFSGGSQMTTGLVEKVSTNAAGATTLEVKDFNGTSKTYTVPDGIAVLVDDDLGVITDARPGQIVELQVGIETNELYGVAIDTVSAYYQGPVNSVGTIGSAKSVTIRDVFTGRDEVYTVSSNAAVTYNDAVRTTADIEKGWYVTARVTGGIITEVYGYSGSTVVEGTLTSISLEAITVLEVTQANGQVNRYSLDIINSLPTITRGGKASTIDKLTTGDTLVVTVRYNRVEKIEATPRSANLTGTVSSINRTLSGTTLGVTFADGTTTEYALSAGVSVTQDGLAVSADSLSLGYTVGLVTDGTNLISVEITGTSSVNGSLEGTVFTVDAASRTMTIKVKDAAGRETTYTVNVRTASLMQPATGKTTLRLDTDFAFGDRVTVYGAFSMGVYQATSVVKW